MSEDELTKELLKVAPLKLAEARHKMQKLDNEIESDMYKLDRKIDAIFAKNPALYDIQQKYLSLDPPIKVFTKNNKKKRRRYR